MQKVERYERQGEETNTGAEAESERKLESNTKFADRIRAEGGAVFEAKGRQYSYRRFDRGTHSIQRAGKVQKGLIGLEIDAIVVGSDIEENKKNEEGGRSNVL